MQAEFVIILKSEILETDISVNNETNEENNEPILPKASIVGAHRVAQNTPFQSHLFDSLDFWPEICNQFTAPFGEELMRLEENCQSSTLMELSNRARSNFKILQLGGIFF